MYIFYLGGLKAKLCGGGVGGGEGLPIAPLVGNICTIHTNVINSFTICNNFITNLPMAQ